MAGWRRRRGVRSSEFVFMRVHGSWSSSSGSWRTDSTTILDVTDRHHIADLDESSPRHADVSFNLNVSYRFGGRHAHVNYLAQLTADPSIITSSSRRRVFLNYCKERRTRNPNPAGCRNRAVLSTTNATYAYANACSREVALIYLCWIGVQYQYIHWSY